MIEMLSPTLLVGVVKSTWLQRRPVSRMKTESEQAGNSGNERDSPVPHRLPEDQHKRSGGTGRAKATHTCDDCGSPCTLLPSAPGL